MSIVKGINDKNRRKLEELDDGELLNIYKTSNDRRRRDDAFNVIYERYRLNVINYIRVRGSGLVPWDAEKVFVNVWTIAFEKFKTFEWRGISLQRFIISTTRFQILKICNENEKRFLLEEYSKLDRQVEEPINAILKQESDQVIHKAIGDMTNELQKKIINLIYFCGVNKSKDIAKILKEKPSTIRVNHGRALQELKKLLSETHIRSLVLTDE